MGQPRHAGGQAPAGAVGFPDSLSRTGVWLLTVSLRGPNRIRTEGGLSGTLASSALDSGTSSDASEHTGA